MNMWTEIISHQRVNNSVQCSFVHFRSIAFATKEQVLITDLSIVLLESIAAHKELNLLVWK